MPNKAKYLTPYEIDRIISLRGKEQPRKIAERYQIGLTRLYKIWTDASEDKKFPGGFAGTTAGQHLTSQMGNLQHDIDDVKAEYNKLMARRDDYAVAIKKLNESLKHHQEMLSSMIGKLHEYKEKQNLGEETIIALNRKSEEYVVVGEKIKNLTSLIQQQQQTPTQLETTVNANKEKLQQLQQQNVELETIIARDEDLQRRLIQHFPVEKSNYAALDYSFD